MVVPEDVLRYYLMDTDRTDFCSWAAQKDVSCANEWRPRSKVKLNEIVQNSSAFMPLTATGSRLQEEKHKDKQMMMNMMKKKNSEVFLKT